MLIIAKLAFEYVRTFTFFLWWLIKLPSSTTQSNQFDIENTVFRYIAVVHPDKDFSLSLP